MYRRVKFYLSIGVGVPFLCSAGPSTLRSLFPGSALMDVQLSALAPLLVPLSELIVVFFLILAAFKRSGIRFRQVLAIAALSIPTLWTGLRSGDYLHLLLLSPYYLYIIENSPDADTKPVVFSWGEYEGFVTDGFHSRELVYDRSGADAEAAEMTKHDQLSQIGDTAFYSYHFIGSFYIRSSWYAGTG